MDKYFRKFFNDFDSLFNNDFDSLYNQFGVVGKIKTETGKDSSGDFTKQTFTSNDGTVKIVSVVRTTSSSSGTKTPDLSTKIGDLKAELESLVEKQEFEKACQVRDKIKVLEENGKKVQDLERELAEAIKSQNFEKAIEIRDQLKNLKA